MRAFVVVAALLAGCGGKPVPTAPPSPGPVAANGSVTTADGARLELASVWQAHPIVLVFYRGFY